MTRLAKDYRRKEETRHMAGLPLDWVLGWDWPSALRTSVMSAGYAGLDTNPRRFATMWVQTSLISK